MTKERNESSRVTTREFYRALLDIKPQIKEIYLTLQELQKWAQGKNGVETRLQKVDRRIVTLEQNRKADAARRRTLRTVARVLHAVFYAAVALLSAFIGSFW